MTTDLAKPVIIATVPVPDGGPPAPLLIDGYARPVTVRSEAAAVHWSVPECGPTDGSGRFDDALTGLADPVDRVQALRAAPGGCVELSGRVACPSAAFRSFQRSRWPGIRRR
jgi:hypothetical protein